MGGVGAASAPGGARPNGRLSDAQLAEVVGLRSGLDPWAVVLFRARADYLALIGEDVFDPRAAPININAREEAEGLGASVVSEEERLRLLFEERERRARHDFEQQLKSIRGSGGAGGGGGTDERLGDRLGERAGDRLGGAGVGGRDNTLSTFRESGYPKDPHRLLDERREPAPWARDGRRDDDDLRARSERYPPRQPRGDFGLTSGYR